MSFKQFLMEGETLEAPALAEFVVKNCKEFLRETNFQISHGSDIRHIISPRLYRGLGNFSYNTGYILEGDRKRFPVDSSPQLTETLDEYFTQKFGYPYRKKGVFCSGSPTFSSNYGNVFMIFPTDGYDCVWSEEVEDAYTALDFRKGGEYPVFARRICERMGVEDPFVSLRKGTVPEDVVGKVEELAWAQWDKIVSEWLRKETPYQDGNLLQAMTYVTKPEIMLRCKQYVAVPIRSGYAYEFVDEMVELSSQI